MPNFCSQEMYLLFINFTIESLFQFYKIDCRVISYLAFFLWFKIFETLSSLLWNKIFPKRNRNIFSFLVLIAPQILRPTLKDTALKKHGTIVGRISLCAIRHRSSIGNWKQLWAIKERGSIVVVSEWKLSVGSRAWN